MSTPAERLLRVPPDHHDQVEHRRLLADGANQNAARTREWTSQAAPHDLVPMGADQWVGDEHRMPIGVAVGTPTGDPNDQGIQGVVARREAASGGMAVIGYVDQAPMGDGSQANAPAEVAGVPVLLMGPVYVEVQNPITDNYYLLLGPSTTLADGRHASPLIIGPQYIPAQSELATDSRDLQLDGLGTLVDVVTLGPLANSYAPGISMFSYDVRLSEEGGRTSHFDVEIWADIGGSGMSFMYRDEYALSGAAQNFSSSTPIDTAINAGDSIQMRVSATDTHPQSDPWVRGSVRTSELRLRQG